jgi:hypothetical protein
MTKRPPAKHPRSIQRQQAHGKDKAHQGARFISREMKAQARKDFEYYASRCIDPEARRLMLECAREAAK